MLAIMSAAFALVSAPSVEAGGNERLSYDLDARESRVSARVAFFGLASKTATFPRMEGRVQVVPGAPERAVIDVTLDARALEAPDDVTLRRLRGDKFFWVERYPQVRFEGRGIVLETPTRGRVTGQLTARGVTRPETLSVEFARDPTIEGAQPIDLTGRMEIDRRDYGMRSYALIVGNTVRISLRARLLPRR